VVESELVLLGTDYDNEGKPIAYLGQEKEGELQFAGTAVLTLAEDARNELQKRIAKLLTTRPTTHLAQASMGKARALG
jgi:hypothetical protein